MPELTPLNKDQFESKVRRVEMPVVLDFGAGWCAPCKLLALILDELAEKYAKRVDFFRVDVDQNPDLVMNCGVMSDSTLILFMAGEPVKRLMCYQPKSAIERALFGVLKQ